MVWRYNEDIMGVADAPGTGQEPVGNAGARAENTSVEASDEPASCLCINAEVNDRPILNTSGNIQCDAGGTDSPDIRIVRIEQSERVNGCAGPVRRMLSRTARRSGQQ